MFSLIVLRFYVIVIILTYYITAFRLIIKIQASVLQPAPDTGLERTGAG